MAKKQKKPVVKSASKPKPSKAPKTAKPAKSAAKPVKVAAKVKPVSAKKVEKVKVAKTPSKVVPKAGKSAKKIEKPKEVKSAKPEKPMVQVPKKEKAPEVKTKPKERAHQLIKEALTEVVMAPLAEKEVILTNADGLRYCKVADCDELSTSDSYCRFHYLLNWKKIQLRKKILMGDKLDRYIEELTARYPDKFLEMIRKDLANEKDFLTAIQELEIDDSGDDAEFEDDARTYIDEVRGVTPTGDDDEF